MTSTLHAPELPNIHPDQDAFGSEVIQRLNPDQGFNNGITERLSPDLYSPTEELPDVGHFSGDLLDTKVQPAADMEVPHLLLHSLKLRDPAAFAQKFEGMTPQAKGRFDAFESREDSRIKANVPEVAKFITKLSARVSGLEQLDRDIILGKSNKK